MAGLEKTGKSPERAIKHIGLWNRQVEFIQEETHFPMPAVFVEFGKIAWRHQMGGMQDADLTVGLHVLTAAVPEGYDGAEFHLDLLDKINRCLHGFGGESWGSFKRSASIPCHDHEEISEMSGFARYVYPNKVSCNSCCFSMTAGFVAALM